MRAEIDGVHVTLAATCSELGELVVVAGSRISGNLLKRYKLRWFIELFFKSIKSMGFNLEKTHITDPDRIMVLMATIAIATCVVTEAGIFIHQIKPIPIKKHGRKAYATFTYGLRIIRCLFQVGKDVFIQEFGCYLSRKSIPPYIFGKLFFMRILGHFFVGY